MEAALRFLKNTESTIQDLARTSRSGSPFLSNERELANLRYRRVPGFPQQLIFFLENPAAIEVVRILHGARNLEVELKKEQVPSDGERGTC